MYRKREPAFCKRCLGQESLWSAIVGAFVAPFGRGAIVSDPGTYDSWKFEATGMLG